MIDKLSYIESKTFDPYKNPALEEYLMLGCGENECILYLWQNKKTVVIGRNQNPWKECRAENLRSDGGFIARRLSGGGAVYHDTGNLNFTFLVRKDNYSVSKQLDVIIKAVRKLGITALRSGRNDILTDGRKFSGNAFYRTGDFCYHHGTIMMDVNTDDLSRYLSVPEDKLKSKGVSSVKSRVTNLKKINGDITAELLKKSMLSAFEEVYSLKAEPFNERRLDKSALAPLEEKFSSWDWLYGENPAFENEFSYRFDWGSADLHINAEKGRITDIILYSDCLDTDFIPELEKALTGVKYDKAEICRALSQYAGIHDPSDPRYKMAKDIEEKIKQENF